MQSCDQKKLSEFEVAQLEKLTRRMDDWQRGGLWLWLNGGFLQDRSLWDARTKAPPEEKMPGTRTSVVRGARQNPRRRAGGDRSGIAAAGVSVD
jgi:hypothetical protein